VGFLKKKLGGFFWVVFFTTALVAGDLNQTVVSSTRSLDFVRSRFTRDHPCEPELLSAIRHLSIF